MVILYPYFVNFYLSYDYDAASSYEDFRKNKIIRQITKELCVNYFLESRVQCIQNIMNHSGNEQKI